MGPPGAFPSLHQSCNPVVFERFVQELGLKCLCFFVPRNPKDFKLKKQLASSDTCVVYIAYARPSSFPVVLKIHCKTRLSAISKHQLAREVHVHSRLDHPNILQLVWLRPLCITQTKLLSAFLVMPITFRDPENQVMHLS